MIRDGIPQLRVALGRQMGQELIAVVQHHLPLQPHPDGEGEARGGGVGGQIQLPSVGLRFGCRRAVGGGGVVAGGFHEIAHLLLGAQVPLRQQLGIGTLHRHLADLQMGGQRPL